MAAGIKTAGKGALFGAAACCCRDCNVDGLELTVLDVIGPLCTDDTGNP